MNIGPYKLSSPLILAPMAGVTDLPFRQLCRRMGAAFVVSEMVSSKPELRYSRKSQQRMVHQDETEPRSVQIVGTDPDEMAAAALFNVEHGAQIIDINMGCPAKKVCNVAAGSALLADEAKVAKILERVVNAVDVPVTLKIRTGTDPQSRNAINIAHIAENSGIQALSIHGRTRACKFNGEAEYQTIRDVKQQASIPVIANGDITSVLNAKYVMEFTGADAIMIARGAQGRPWIFREMKYFLETGKRLAPIQHNELMLLVLEHLETIHRFYGEQQGVRIARKHIKWYLKDIANPALIKTLMQADTATQQLALMTAFFQQRVAA